MVLHRFHFVFKFNLELIQIGAGTLLQLEHSIKLKAALPISFYTKTKLQDS